MNLKPEIKSFILDQTAGLYDGYFLELDKLCLRLGLKCFEAEFGSNSLSGAIMPDDNGPGFTIYVNKDHHPNRQRFTVAHEIGHFISYKCNSLSHEQLEKCEGFEDYAIALRVDGLCSEAETEANQIAAELLMPEEKVRELVAKNTSMETMGRYFGVSESAISIRLNRLDYRVIG